MSVDAKLGGLRRRREEVGERVVGGKGAGELE